MVLRQRAVQLRQPNAHPTQFVYLIQSLSYIMIYVVVLVLMGELMICVFLALLMDIYTSEIMFVVYIPEWAFGNKLNC
jgi:hypothetical protein